MPEIATNPNPEPSPVVASPAWPLLVETLRTLPRPAWILFAGTFLNKFGTFVIPFLTIYLTRRGFSAGQVGIALAAYGVGHGCASGFGGYLADRIGRRNTIVLSMFSSAVSMLLLSQATRFPAILMLTALVAMTGDLYRPASQALLADLVGPGRRVTTYSVYRLAFNAGWAFGPATAGLLANHSFFLLFAGDALTSALFGIVAWIGLPHGLGRVKERVGWRFIARQVRSDRQFRYLLAASFFIALVYMQMSSTFGLHVTASGFSPAVYGALISLNGVLVVFCELPLTMITQRFPARRVIAFGYALVGAGFALNAVAHTIAGLLIVVLLFTVGEMVNSPVAAAYVADLAPVSLRGRYMGILGVTWSLAVMSGPSLGTVVFAHRPQALWLGCGLLAVVATVLMLLSPSPAADERKP